MLRRNLLAAFTAAMSLGLLLLVGMREAHRTTGGRAAVIVVTPILVLLGALLLLIALLVALGLTAGDVLHW